MPWQLFELQCLHICQSKVLLCSTSINIHSLEKPTCLQTSWLLETSATRINMCGQVNVFTYIISCSYVYLNKSFLDNRIINNFQFGYKKHLGSIFISTTNNITLQKIATKFVYRYNILESISISLYGKDCLAVSLREEMDDPGGRTCPCSHISAFMATSSHSSC